MRAKISEFIESLTLYTILAVIVVCILIGTAGAKQPKAKFYDFKDQLIDGEIKKPATLYTDSRKNVKFERLLRLKKSFMRDLYQTAKERIFR
tara:strand:+ start:1535 stop:1810 length:276 start_codon:yes stop_codon:yes gene_type:complete